MNIKLNDGTVRCTDHMDSAQYQGLTNEPCLYCPAEEVTEEAPAETVPVKAPATRISPRQASDTYWVRRSPQYKGDLVNRWSRTVNGRGFTFVHITWACGNTSLQVFEANTTTTLHYFAS